MIKAYAIRPYLCTLMRGFCLFVLLAVLAAMGCARIVPPDGGAKDTLAPVLLSSVPPQGATNFKGQKAVLVFSEWIALSNLSQQLLISPTIENPYTATVRKNRLTLEFLNPLPDDATLNLNFRDAVVDINEKNKAPNLILAFSTGPQIDTFAMAGRVTDIFTGKEVPEATVGLYPMSDTLDIARQRPQYATRTDAAGVYVLGNLKQGRYFAAAFSEKLSNLRWGGKTEKLGFPTDSVFVLTGDTSLNFVLGPVDDAPPRIERARIEDSSIVIKTDEAPVRFSARMGTDTVPFVIDIRQATTTLYPSLPLPADTVRVRFILADSSGNRIDTLLAIGRPTAAQQKRDRRDGDKPRAAPVNRITQDPANGSALALPGEVVFIFPMPVVNIDSGRVGRPANTKVLLRKDTLTTPRRLRGYWSADRSRLTVLVPSLGLPRFELLMPVNSYRLVQNRALAGDTSSFTWAQEDQLGLLRGKPPIKGPNVITELLSEAGVILRQARGDGPFAFANLQPGNYLVRFVQDANRNGQWDAGSYRLKRQPELIVPPVKPYHVKANWEVELE